jgi:hypothetical protein
MFKKFAIKVTSRFIAAPEANTQEEYVIEYKAKRDFLRRSNSPRATWSTAAEAEAVIEELPVRRAGAFPQKHSYEIEEINYTHANQNGYSDTTPFEIVRVVSNKTIELRSMSAERHPDWKPEFVSGGFAGHCTNNGDQRNAWIIKSDPEGYTVRARLQKDGSWKSSHGRHSLHTAAIKHYDYNF